MLGVFGQVILTSELNKVNPSVVGSVVFGLGVGFYTIYGYREVSGGTGRVFIGLPGQTVDNYERRLHIGTDKSSFDLQPLRVYGVIRQSL